MTLSTQLIGSISAAFSGLLGLLYRTAAANRPYPVDKTKLSCYTSHRRSTTFSSGNLPAPQCIFVLRTTRTIRSNLYKQQRLKFFEKNREGHFATEKNSYCLRSCSSFCYSALAFGNNSLEKGSCPKLKKRKSAHDEMCYR